MDSGERAWIDLSSLATTMSVLIETTLGDIVVDLFVRERPNCCRNFLKLCKIKYYNLCQIFNIEVSGKGIGAQKTFINVMRLF